MNDNEKEPQRPPPVTELKPREDCRFILDIDPLLLQEIRRRLSSSEFERFQIEFTRLNQQYP